MCRECGESGSYLVLASPADNRVLMIDGESGEQNVLSVPAEHFKGCVAILPDQNGEELWMLPYTGTCVVCWNPKTNEAREYSDVPEGFKCKNRPHGYECEDIPFGHVAFDKNFIIFPPYWGNMFLRLDRNTGTFEEWKPPFDVTEDGKNGYFVSGNIGAFVRRTDTLGEGTYRFFLTPDRKLYDVNVETGRYEEIDIVFDWEELREHESGFDNISEWLQYACLENAFNSLEDFLDGDISGKLFDRKRQIQTYEEIAANNDGTSGEKIHRFVRETL